MKITKVEILKSANGHPQKFCGVGVHRNWKKQPKGGRSAQNSKAIKEW